MFIQLPIRPRLKRVNLRDLLFLLEQEKETCRTPLLYKAFLKWWWLCLVCLPFLWQKVRSGDIKKLSSLPSHTLTEWVLFLCIWLDTSTKSLDSEANKYYVPWISWELSDTTNYSQVNCVMFVDCEWIFLSGNRYILHQYQKHETVHICGSWPSCDLMHVVDCGNFVTLTSTRLGWMNAGTPALQCTASCVRPFYWKLCSCIR